MNITNKIEIRENKTLKLSNVLVRELNENEIKDINKVSYMMESYIKSKKNAIIGPRINYTYLSHDVNGQPRMIVKLLVQLEHPIGNTENPYQFKTQIKVNNCLFARFIEKESNIEYVYSKLNLYAFENDMKLRGDSYTIFVDKKEEKIVVDVFMEMQRGEVLANL